MQDSRLRSALGGVLTILGSLAATFAMLGALLAVAAAQAAERTPSAGRPLPAPVAEVRPADVHAAALAAPGRSSADRERDARDRPAEVLAFAGVAPGMTVADVFGGGGYYAELLASVVGPTGRVLLVNNAPYVAFAGNEYEARFAKDRLPEVERSVVESCNLGLAPASLDVAMIVLSYHDLYHYDPRGWPRIDVANFLEQIRRAVKPGGAFLIVDHAAAPGTAATAADELHRIDESFAVRDIESHGFVLEKRWDGLRNAADDRSVRVFDPRVRGRTDRFVHLYRRRS